MIHEQSRSNGIIGCIVLGSLCIVAMAAIKIAGHQIPSELSTALGAALGIIGTLVNTYTAERSQQIPPK